MKTYDFIQSSKEISEMLSAIHHRFRDMMVELDVMYAEYTDMKCELAQLKQLDPKKMMASIKKQIDEEFRNKYGSS